MNSYSCESQLKKPLIEWLRRKRRISEQSIVLHEMPWYGRKVDLVTMTKSKMLTSYEFKLNGFRRAVEQAAFNRMTFDRSYIVTFSRPTNASLQLAGEVGVGVIVVKNNVEQILNSPFDRPEKPVRRVILAKVRDLGKDV